MKVNNLIRIIILVAVIGFAAWRWYTREQTLVRTEFALDTVVELNVTASGVELESLLDSTFALISYYEKKLSYYSEDGLIRIINDTDSLQYRQDEDLYRLLTYGSSLYTQTDSLYDLTVGQLSSIWDFDSSKVPSQTEIEQARTLTGFSEIKFDDEILHKPTGFRFNLGSIAKGYIVDQAVEFLKAEGVSSGIVNAGGDLRIFGRTQTIRVGIQHPRAGKNEIIDVLNVKNMSIVTSGDYERFFIRDGIRYHHILDPRTGYPAANAVSVTVICAEAMEADALSTALFLLKPDQGIALIDSKNGVEALIYYEDNGEIRKKGSKGIQKYLE